MIWTKFYTISVKILEIYQCKLHISISSNVWGMREEEQVYDSLRRSYGGGGKNSPEGSAQGMINGKDQPFLMAN